MCIVKSHQSQKGNKANLINFQIARNVKLFAGIVICLTQHASVCLFSHVICGLNNVRKRTGDGT